MTKHKVAYNQVTILPWFSVVNELKVGKVIFWKYNVNKIKDKSIKHYLDKYVGCYVDITGKKQQDVVIASLDNKKNFAVLSPQQHLMIKAARDLVCFTAIAPHSLRAVNQDNKSLAPPSSERFQMFSQNFVCGTEDIAFKAGSHTTSLSGGWKLDEVKFAIPLYLGGSLFSIDRKILQALSRLLPSLNNPGDKPNELRLFRALEWFRLAHVENDEVSIFSKVVMMSTAFEILYDVSNVPGKSDYIADKIDSIFVSVKLVRATRRINKANIRHTLAGWWGWDFYKLRNRIVHGDTVTTDDLIYKNWLTHLIVADLVFLKSVIKYLYIFGYYAKDVKKMFNELSNQEAEENMIDFITGFSCLYKRLSWEKQSNK